MTPRVLRTRGVMHWWYWTLSLLRRERDASYATKYMPAGSLRDPAGINPSLGPRT